MKTLRISFYLSILFLTGLFASRVNAQILITIDDSNPAAVTFTATGNDPSVSDATHLFSQGIVFANFVTTAHLIPSITATSASLTTGVDGMPFYDEAQSGSITGTFADLQLSTTSAATENFNAGTAAFAGVSTFDFSANSAFLPAAGFSGALYAGSNQIFSPAAVVIGSYQVVPEPSSWALIVVGAIALLAVGARAKSRRRALA